MTAIKTSLTARLRQAWNILTRRRHYFYVDFAGEDGMTSEDTLRSTVFIAGTIWAGKHDPVSAEARTQMLTALLTDCDTLMFYRTEDGGYRVAYACDTPETLSELRDLDFKADDEPTNGNNNDTDSND